MLDLILLVLMALVVPTLFAVIAARFFAQRSRTGIGILVGLGFIVASLAVGSTLMGNDIEQRVLRCQQLYQMDAATCRFASGEWSGLIYGAIVACAIIDATIFLLIGLYLARRDKRALALSSTSPYNQSQ